MHASPPSRNSIEPAKRPATIPVLLFLIAGILVFLAIHWRSGWKDWWMEDIPIFRSAIGEWLAGRSPYTSQVAPLYYIYPPIFIFIAGGFARLVGLQIALVVYLAAHFAAVLALPLVLAKYLLRQPWLTPLVALLLFFVGPLYMGEEALLCCNVATLIYCSVFVAAAPGVLRNRWEWFYLVVIAVTLVKFTLLPLLLLPLFAGKKQWGKSIATAAVVGVLYVVQKAEWPSLYAGYLWAVRQCIVIPVHYGFGVFGVLAHYFAKLTGRVGLMPYAVLGLLGLALFVSLVLMRRRMDRVQSPINDGVWVGMIICAIFLMNPRLMQYEADIPVFCCVPLLVYAFRVRRPLLCWAACYLPALALPLAMANGRMWGAYGTLLILGSYIAAYRRMWRETAELEAQPVVEGRKKLAALGEARA